MHNGVTWTSGKTYFVSIGIGSVGIFSVHNIVGTANINGATLMEGEPAFDQNIDTGKFVGNTIDRIKLAYGDLVVTFSAQDTDNRLFLGLIQID